MTFDQKILTSLWRALEIKTMTQVCDELQVQKAGLKEWLITGKPPSLQAKARLMTWYDEKVLPNLSKPAKKEKKDDGNVVQPVS